MKTLLMVAGGLAACSLAVFAAEEKSVDTRTFANAHLVIVDNVDGSIDATGYSGNDVQMEVTKRIEAESDERMQAAKKEVRLDIQQSGDTLKLYVDGPFRCHCDDCCDHGRNGDHGHRGYQVHFDFKLRVPAAARVDLYTVNGGQIFVRDVTGGFDVHNVNGRIEMSGMGSGGTAKTVNGGVKVVFAKNPSVKSEFETVNGNVDLTFRPGLSADARMQTMNGELLTDFDVTALPVEAAETERHGGKFVFKRGGSTGVRIGAGGTDIRMKTLNGDIFIREGK